MASKSYFCPVCPPLAFDSRKGLSRHYSLLHKTCKIPCPQCKVEVSTVEALKRHLQTHESNRIRGFKCSVGQCDKSFYTTTEAKGHFARTHSAARPFPCPFNCGKSFKTKEEVNLHLLSHTNEKAHKCEQCDASYKTIQKLKRHVKFCHTFPDEKPCECSECGTKFKENDALKRHVQRRHTPRTKDFPCSLCPKQFFSKGELKKHSETHNSERKLVDCYFCPKQLTQRSSMDRHLRIHTTEKPFICPEKSCNYSSATSNFRPHVRDVHHQSQDRKKPSCYFCLATFSVNYVIVNHMRIHTQEMPFLCKLCGKSFNQASILNTHIRRNHTKEKPHKCKQCEKCFSFSGELKQHTAFHTGEKRFFCVICGYSSYYSGNLKLHRRRRHKITEIM